MYSTFWLVSEKFVEIFSEGTQLAESAADRWSLFEVYAAFWSDLSRLSETFKLSIGLHVMRNVLEVCSDPLCSCSPSSCLPRVEFSEASHNWAGSMDPPGPQASRIPNRPKKLPPVSATRPPDLCEEKSAVTVRERKGLYKSPRVRVFADVFAPLVPEMLLRE
jgi:hypothetical protein